jgi:hypothetical protein
VFCEGYLCVFGDPPNVRFFPAKLDYISRRFSKAYPTYLLWTLLDLPGTIVKHIPFARQCPLLYWLSLG